MGNVNWALSATTCLKLNVRPEIPFLRWPDISAIFSTGFSDIPLVLVSLRGFRKRPNGSFRFLQSAVKYRIIKTG